MNNVSNRALRHAISELRKHVKTLKPLSDSEKDFVEKFECNYFANKTIDLDDIVRYARIFGYEVTLNFTKHDDSYNVSTNFMEFIEN